MSGVSASGAGVAGGSGGTEVPRDAILVVEDNRGQLDAMVFTLADHDLDAEHGVEVLTATSGRDALAILERERERLAVVLTDLKMPGPPDGIGLLSEAVRLAPRARRILVTAYAGELTLADAVNAGRINRLLEKGYRADELVRTVREALDEHRALQAVIHENERLERERVRTIDGIVGASAEIRRLRDETARVSRVGTHVLLLGETGTGKELVARAIHDASPRAGGPFVAVNCAAIPESLLEGEFFGTRRGAFSGAVDRAGLVEAAASGTLFLDEIGKAPVAIQAKLLRFLDTGRFLPVGAREEKRADVRVVAAANEDLEAAIEDGRFLRDLFYRLRGSRIRIPRLADRIDDVPAIARHWLDRMNREYSRAVLGFDDQAMAAMRAHSWPGNVRELVETIRDAVVRKADDGTFLSAADLGLGACGTARARAQAEPATEERPTVPSGPSLEVAVAAELARGRDLNQIRADVERAALSVALIESGWVIETAARRLGVSRPWIYDRLERFEMQRPDADGGVHERV
ncbi:MAG: sigma-54-dependent Fis family transcriptional regulator [Deltaproteobacteria bacterium]|nr:sigma-54-dependent Fis family transcriptional regulator [Deltaproteobacteria bacterium]